MPSTLPQTPNDNCGNANGINYVANLANMLQHQMGNAPPNPGNQNDQLLDASGEEEDSNNSSVNQACLEQEILIGGAGIESEQDLEIPVNSGQLSFDT
jgi:hypothetical protein